jgi:hypothetical protein
VAAAAVRLTAAPDALGEPAAVVPVTAVPPDVEGAVAAEAEATIGVGRVVTAAVVGAGAVVPAAADAAALVGAGVSVAFAPPPHAASRSGSANSPTTPMRDHLRPYPFLLRISPLLLVGSARTASAREQAQS